MKRIIAVLMSVLLVLLMMSSAAFGANASDNAQQILSEGGSKSNDAKDITISKVISPTEDENYFDITLTVEKKLPATDVVMVMDISNTMNTNNRIGKARNAAKAFLKQYSETVGINDDSRIGMVTFNSNASVIFELANADENLSSFTSKIDDITAPSSNSVKFTNIEAGLQLAQNLLKASDAKQKYIILITDGFPTTYIESGRDSTTEIKGYDVYRTYKNPPSGVPSAPADGLFYDFVRKLPCNGTSYSDTAAIKARELATRIKNSGIDIYSIGIDISNESQTIQKYIDVSTPIVERTSESYEVGSATDSTAYVNWLGKKIGGGPDLTNAGVTNAFSRGDTETQLETAFTTVLTLIATAEPMDVTDPMGENVEFLGFYNKNGNLTDRALKGSYALSAENTASYGPAISWDIDSSGYTEKDNDNITYRTFSLKYKVRLTNEASDFVAEKKYNTNGTTVLEYKTIDMDDSDAAKKLNFPIPAVEGYFGSLEFTKVNNGGDKLSNAQFRLSHAESCAVCGGDISIEDKTDNSDSNGKISFDSVPSGHEYVLAETKTPSGHINSGKTYKVEITYGKTYIDGSEQSDFEIENELFASTYSDSVSGKVKLKEGENDKPVKDGQFTVTIEPDENNDSTGYELPDDKTADVKPDGTFDLGEIKFIKPGTYSFTITEDKGDAAGYTYDGSEYALIYTVEPDDSANEFKITKTVLTKDGNPANEIEFLNRYETPEPVEIDVPGVTTLTGGGKTNNDITEGFFSYTVSGDIDETVSGVPAKAEAAAGGALDFGTWSFSEVGEYEFVISENTPPAGYTDITGDVTVKVVITLDETTNELKADVAYSSGEKVKIDNTYTKPAPVKVDIPGITTLTGGGKTNNDITEGFFSYTVSGDIDETVSGVPANAEAAAGGALDFGTWSFSEVGEYEFVISENTPPAGYTDITGDVTVKVVITLDETTNELKADVAYSSGEKVKIDNTYTMPDPVTVKLNGRADLIGDKTNEDINEGDFVFYVKADESNNKDAYTGFDEVVNVKTGGALDFGSAEFSEEGTYKFSITQHQFSDGYTYDDSEYMLTYIVTIDESTNEFVVDTVIEKNGEKADSVKFVNEYKKAAIEEDTPSDSPSQIPGGNSGGDGKADSENEKDSQPSQGTESSGGSQSSGGIMDLLGGLLDFGSDNSEEQPSDSEEVTTAPEEESKTDVNKDTAENEDKFELPFTGSESSASLVFVFIFVMSAAATVILRKKRMGVK